MVANRQRVYIQFSSEPSLVSVDCFSAFPARIVLEHAAIAPLTDTSSLDLWPSLPVLCLLVPKELQHPTPEAVERFVRWRDVLRSSDVFLTALRQHQCHP